MDIDGDGVLSMYELEYFYEEQAKKMELTGIEPMPFIDVMCQVDGKVIPEGSFLTDSAYTQTDAGHR